MYVGGIVCGRYFIFDLREDYPTQAMECARGQSRNVFLPREILSINAKSEDHYREGLRAVEEMISGLDICAVTDEVIRTAVISQGQGCLSGAASQEDTVSVILQRTNLYLAE